MNPNCFSLFLTLVGFFAASALEAQQTETSQSHTSEDIVPGVSYELASQRKSAISEVKYDLSFDLSEKTEPIPSSIKIRFALANSNNPIVLDFNSPKANVQSVSLATIGGNGEPERSTKETTKGH